MTFFLWVTWQCSKCFSIHRARFDVITGWKCRTGRLAVSQGYAKEGITIFDSALAKEQQPSKARPSGSKIYCDPYDSIPKISGVLTEYMEQHYSIAEGSLVLEVCQG